MKQETPVSPLRVVELWLVVLIPAVALLAGAVMLHVASTFGFTALGEPAAVVATHAR